MFSGPYHTNIPYDFMLLCSFHAELSTLTVLPIPWASGPAFQLYLIAPGGLAPRSILFLSEGIANPQSPTQQMTPFLYSQSLFEQMDCAYTFSPTRMETPETQESLIQ